jgi:hypothetical protein
MTNNINPNIKKRWIIVKWNQSYNMLAKLSHMKMFIDVKKKLN